MVKKETGPAGLKKLSRSYRKQIALVARRLNAHRWAEKNAGNFSLRLKEGLLTKISGAQMKNIARTPLPYLCFVKPAKTGFRYSVLPETALPTSEIFAHIASQRTLATCRPGDRALLHTHPTELVRLSRRYPEPQKLLTALLARAKPGSAPRSITAIPMLPHGSIAIARATARRLKTHRLVIWPNHGVIAAGKNLLQALKLIEKVNRLAALALKR